MRRPRTLAPDPAHRSTTAGAARPGGGVRAGHKRHTRGYAARRAGRSHASRNGHRRADRRGWLRYELPATAARPPSSSAERGASSARSASRSQQTPQDERRTSPLGLRPPRRPGCRGRPEGRPTATCVPASPSAARPPETPTDGPCRRPRPRDLPAVIRPGDEARPRSTSTCRWATRSGATKVPLPADGVDRRKFLTPEELDHLLDTAEAEVPAFFPLIYVAAYTGMRQGELLALPRDGYSPLGRPRRPLVAPQERPRRPHEGPAAPPGGPRRRPRRRAQRPPAPRQPPDLPHRAGDAGGGRQLAPPGSGDRCARRRTCPSCTSTTCATPTRATCWPPGCRSRWSPSDWATGPRGPRRMIYAHAMPNQQPSALAALRRRRRGA